MASPVPIPLPLTLGAFGALDWGVLVGYMALTSVLGVALAGKQSTMEDFFRGGNKLPWYAVAGSMIATIISAVTFVGVPAVIYRETGNFSYLQFGIIAGLLSRLFVALVLVPVYYRYKVYSPYDYMGLRLGESARSITTALFTLLGVLAQAARVYLTAVILELLLHDQFTALEAATGVGAFAWSVIAVGVVAVAWTMLGGIATVIWTDAMLFLVFVIGGIIALAVVAFELPGGLGQLVHDAAAAHKFDLWNLQLSFDAEQWRDTFTQPYTLVAAIFAVTFGNIGSYGTDQLLAQRIFCCKNANHAKAAVMASWAGELVVALMLLVGAGLWVFYQQFPDALDGEWGQAVADNPDNIFPVFIITQVPAGLTGLIIAGIFAAAISSLTSILAALSQTTLSAVYLPMRRINPDAMTDVNTQREVLRVSRGLIVFWGIALCAAAFAVDAYVDAMREAGRDVPFLDLALGLASYVIGALFGAFLLAWLPLRVSGYGLLWAAPLSVFTVFASRFHDDALPGSLRAFFTAEPGQFWALRLCAGVGVVLIVTWIIAAMLYHDRPRRKTLLLKTGWLVIGCAVTLWTTAYGWFDGNPGGAPIKLAVAWPWYAPIGGAVAFVFGYLLGNPREQAQSP